MLSSLMSEVLCLDIQINLSLCNIISFFIDFVFNGTSARNGYIMPHR